MFNPTDLLERERRSLNQECELVDAWSMARGDDELMIVVYDAVSSAPIGNLGTMTTRRFAVYTNHSQHASVGGIVSSWFDKESE